MSFKWKRTQIKGNRKTAKKKDRRPNSAARGYDHLHRQCAELLKWLHGECVLCRLRSGQQLHHTCGNPWCRMGNLCGDPNCNKWVCKQCHNEAHGKGD